MALIVELLMILAIVISIYLSVMWYSGNTWTSGDPFFFLRKKQFKKKLLADGYESTWDLVDSVMNMEEDSWEVSDRKMIQPIYPNTQFVFTNNNGLQLSIQEGNKGKTVFEVTYYEEEHRFKDGEDFVTKKKLASADEFRMKHILLYLNKVLDRQVSRDYQLKLKARLRDEKLFMETKHETKEQLLFLLGQELPLGDGYRRYGYTLQFKREKNHQSLLISFDDVLYFQALQMEYLGDVSTTIHHTENAHAQLFLELKKELDLYAKKLFIDHPLRQPSKMERYLKTFEEDYDQLLFSIHQLSTHLQNETEWLSVESLHQLNETFPNDLKALSEVYRTMLDKEEVRSDVEEALHMIERKLQTFQEEAERNKKFQIQKTKHVIEKR